MGFSSVPSILPSLECRLLAQEKLIVALPLHHPAARRGEIDLKRLAGERFLIPPRGLMAGLHEGIIQACHRAGFDPKFQAIRQAETALWLVAGNLGIALVPQSYRRLKVQGVVYREILHEMPLIEFYAIRRRNSETPLTANFWGCIEAEGH